MPAELGLYRLLGHHAGLERERRLGKLGNHRLAGEVADVPAVRAGWTDGRLGRHLGKIGAALDSFDNLARGRLVLDQDVPGADFLYGRPIAHHRVVARGQRFLADALVDQPLEIDVANDIALGERDTAPDLLVILEVRAASLGRDEGKIDHALEKRREERLERQVAILVGQGFLEGNNLREHDLGAVNARDDWVLLGKGGRSRNGRGEHGRKREGEEESPGAIHV